MSLPSLCCFIFRLPLVGPQYHRLLLPDDNMSIITAPVSYPLMFNIINKQYFCFQGEPTKFLAILIELGFVATMPKPITGQENAVHFLTWPRSCGDETPLRQLELRVEGGRFLKWKLRFLLKEVAMDVGNASYKHLLYFFNSPPSL